MEKKQAFFENLLHNFKLFDIVLYLRHIWDLNTIRRLEEKKPNISLNESFLKPGVSGSMLTLSSLIALLIALILGGFYATDRGIMRDALVFHCKSEKLRNKLSNLSSEHEV